MAIKASTGLRNKLLDTAPLRTILNLGFIKVYSGPVPATADEPIVGGNVLLATVSNAGTGTGLTFEAAAVGGVIVKKASEVWNGVAPAGLTNVLPTFFRFVAPGDTGLLSTTEARVQGNVAASGADLNLVDVAISTGETVPVDEFNLTIPTL